MFVSDIDVKARNEVNQTWDKTNVLNGFRDAQIQTRNMRVLWFNLLVL